MEDDKTKVSVPEGDWDCRFLEEVDRDEMKDARHDGRHPRGGESAE